MKNPCLVIIDVQEKLFPVMNDHQTLLKNLIILIKGFQLFNLPVIITEQVPEKLGNTIEEIASLFDIVDPVVKSSFSCLGESKFLEKLETINADEIILAGIESHVCVYQTSHDLLQKNKHVEDLIQKNFDLSPRGIREMLGLNKPIYEKSAAYGHFGRDPGTDGSFSWEKVDKKDIFSK